MEIGALRTTSASSIGDFTIAVVIGVGRHADAAIGALPAASVETREIRDALVDPQGCRLRPDHVECLCDEEATRQAILESIGRACQQATPHHSLFIYFAGHGVDVDGQFALVAFDTDVHRCASTGVSARDLEHLIRDIRARGVFLVLDCCGGAALAEGAPGFFRTVGASADHRILLSAARAGQPSREGPKGSSFSRALIEALTGRERLGDEAGAIYFSDLYRFLYDRVTVDLEASRGGSRGQEPMATASYARDPLLFLHAGLTLAQIRVRTQRYSRRQVRTMMLRGLLGAAAATGIAMLGLWAYLAGHYFLRMDDGMLALYRGHPTLRVLDYPRLVWQYDVRAEEIDPSSALAAARPVLSAWGQDFREQPLRHLTAAGRARWLIGENRPQEARIELAALMADPLEVEQDPRAALLAIAIATSDETALLEALARSPRPEVSTAALVRLMHVAPERGTVVAEARGFGPGTRGVHLQLMAELPPGCPAEKQRYLDAFAAGPANGQFARLEIDAALRTGCRLSDAAVASIGEPVNLGLVARYLSVVDPPRGAGLQREFLQAFASHLAGTEVQISLNTSTAYLVGAPPAPACPEVHSLDYLGGPANRLMAARALVYQCPALRLVLSATTDGMTFRCELIQDGQPEVRLVVAELRHDAGYGELMFALDALRLRGATQSATVLLRLALANADASVRRHAVRLLRLAGIPPTGTLASFESTGDQALQTEAYLWVAKADRSKVLSRMQSRLSDETADFLPTAMLRLGLSSQEAHSMLQAAQSAQVGERTRAAVTALLADAATVARQLSDSDARRRVWVADWLGVRRDLAVVAGLLPTPPWPGQLTARDLQLIEDRRAALARELESPQPQQGRSETDDSWRIQLMLDMRQIPDSGLRTWLQARCRWCD